MSASGAASFTWLEGEQNNSLSRSVETLDISDKDGDWAESVPGRKSATADVTVHLDDTATSAQHTMLASLHNGQKVYCTQDDSVDPVGTDNRKKGCMSPRNLLASTIGDQIRMHTDFEAKVIGVSYKDRAAILPAGRSANAAYWLDTHNGQFITSTYYMNELPQWAKEYNKVLKKNKELQKVGSKVGLYPLCGHITTDMAIAALKGENLGKGKTTDMLCVSYSQTDVIGHEWSTRGEHTDEAYLELDKDIARLLKALDEQVGEGNYLAFLTADHGAAHNFQWMQDHGLNGGAWKVLDEYAPKLDQYLKEQLGEAASLKVVAMVNSYRIFLDREGEGSHCNVCQDGASCGVCCRF